MNGAEGVSLSVRAEARQLVPPDDAVLDGMIEHTAAPTEAAPAAAASLDRLTTDLAALGAVPFSESTARHPLMWSAHSSATREERYHNEKTGRMERTGQVTATVAVRVTIRDLDKLAGLGRVLAAHPSLEVHSVTWHADWDNPEWPRVRAAAIASAIRKARDYAAALGATLRSVEHIADTGLLGGDTAPDQAEGRFAAAFSAGGGPPETPELTPVPQELVATIEGRFRTTGVSLPGA
jgi:uncharacterized protein YggE